MREEHDERSRRCPRLGHRVTFRYCRTQEGQALCPRILDCWWETFDVVSWVRENYGEEELERLRQREPKDKRTSILELIQQAKERRGESGPEQD